jgi:hypothetical protein
MIEHFRKRSVAHQILLLNVALMAFLCLTHQSFIGKGAMGETLMSFKIPQNVKTFVGERSWLFFASRCVLLFSMHPGGSYFTRRNGVGRE